MKICIPVMNKQGLESKVCEHFGGAPYFLIYDTDKETFEVIENSNAHHTHGMCHPLKALENQNLNAVVCSGMGARAVQKLNAGGIKAYRVAGEAVEEVLKLYKSNILEEITVENACIDHNCH